MAAMVEQGLGVASVVVVALGYLLLVEAMAAAVCLLGRVVVQSWRSLRALLVEPHPAPASVVDQDHGEPRPSYRLGGDLRW